MFDGTTAKLLTGTRGGGPSSRTLLFYEGEIARSKENGPEGAPRPSSMSENTCDKHARGASIRILGEASNPEHSSDKKARHKVDSGAGG